MNPQEIPESHEEKPKPHVREEDVDRVLNTLIDGKRVYLED
jgi:hypothetical protein